MYIGLRTFDTLHKNTVGIGPGPCRILVLDFQEHLFHAVRCMTFPEV
jgi:hypothetical protein